MARFGDLPNETLQEITGYFSIVTKYEFLRTGRQASQGFADDAVEKAEIWDLLFKDRKWLQARESQGARIALIGSDLSFLKKGLPSQEDKIVALVLIWPKGKSLAKAAEPEFVPERRLE